MNSAFLLHMARGREWTDGSPASLDWLRSHSHDQLAGVDETQGVFYPPTDAQGRGGFHDCCHSWVIEGFICEYYAAPGTFAIGLDRHFDNANQFCADQYGGHLATIHSQEDYDKIADISAGWTQPLLIGLRSDSAGNWEWVDGSPVDIDFLKAHSADQLIGVDENQAVFYPCGTCCPPLVAPRCMQRMKFCHLLL
eukprot:SAG31_NODE_487_length_14980_cov_9.526376_9_plen_195_part_00